MGAGVAYKGSYKTCILGVPFESIIATERDKMMQQIIGFFDEKK
jgi:hypothetical protein